MTSIRPGIFVKSQRDFPEALSVNAEPAPKPAPPSTAPPPSSALSWGEAGLCLLVALLGLKLLAWLPSRTLQPTLVVLCWCLPAYLWIQSRQRDPLVEMALLRPGAAEGWLAFGLFVLLGLPVYVLALTQVRPELQATAQSAQGLVWIFLQQLMFTALAEEAYFRGVLQPALKERWGPWAAIGLGAVAFALAHAVFDASPARLIVFGPALIFGYLRERSDSLWPPVLFHALCNTVYAVYPV